MTANLVVAVDLDDTLFPEEDYVRSGIRAVCRKVEAAFGMDCCEATTNAWNAGESDWLGWLCRELGGGERLKESLLWTYRVHKPVIFLDPAVASALQALRERARHVAIITDGRALTQRLKMTALGLSDIPAYISDEYGGAPKPDPVRFRRLMQDHVAAQYVYIADNVIKDFIAPKRLGWKTLGVSRYAQQVSPPSPQHAPDRWISSFQEVPPLLC